MVVLRWWDVPVDGPFVVLGVDSLDEPFSDVTTHPHPSLLKKLVCTLDKREVYALSNTLTTILDTGPWDNLISPANVSVLKETTLELSPV